MKTSDEDLFDRAHEEFSVPGDEPFFSLVFTSSNHSPYQFPDGRIELYDEEKNTVNNAVKYADFGSFTIGAWARSCCERVHSNTCPQRRKAAKVTARLLHIGGAVG